MTDTKKINVNYLEKVEGFTGLYFDDALFKNLPKSLRVDRTTFKIIPKFDYDDSGKATPIKDTIGGITFMAVNEGTVKLIQQLAADTDLYDTVASIDVSVDVPEQGDPNYPDFKKAVLKIEEQLKDSRHQGQDFILDNAECHVVPVALRGKGNFKKYQGAQLKLFNLGDCKVSFTNPIDK